MPSRLRRWIINPSYSWNDSYSVISLEMELSEMGQPDSYPQKYASFCLNCQFEFGGLQPEYVAGRVDVKPTLHSYLISYSACVAIMWRWSLLPLMSKTGAEAVIYS